MIRQLAHICIHTRDLEATGAFYLEGLGLECGFEFMKHGELFGYYFKLGNGTFLEVFKGEPRAAGNINHFAIEVDNIDAVIDRLKARGHEVSPKSLGTDHTWQAWVTDPNGVRIEFQEYTDRSLQRTGGRCEVNW